MSEPTIRPTIETTQVTNGFKELGGSTNAFAKTIDNLTIKTDKLTASNERYRKSKRKLTADLNAAKASVTTLTGAAASLNAENIRLSTSLSAAHKQITTLTAANAKLTQQNAALTASTTRATAATNANTTANTRNAASHGALHGAIRGTSGALGNLWMTYGQIAPLIAAFSATSMVINVQKMGSAFEYMTSYSAAINGTTAGLANMRKELLNIKNVGKTPVELAEGMVELTRAGRTTEQALKEVGTVAKFATVAQMDMSRATLQLVTLTTAFSRSTRMANGEALDLAGTADIVASAALGSATSFEQFNVAMRYMIPISRKANFSLHEAAAAAMIMADSGLAGSVGTTAIRTALTRMIVPGTAAMKVLKAAGIEMDKFASGERVMNLGEMTLALKKLKEGLTAQEWLTFAYKGVGLRGEQIESLLAEYEKYLDQLKRLQDAAGFLDRTFEMLGETTRMQLIELKAELTRSLIEIFDSPKTVKIIKDFRELVSGKDFKDSIGGLTDAFYAVGEALSTTGKFLARYGEDIVILTGFIVAAKTAQKLFNLIVSRNPYVMVGLALVGLNEKLAQHGTSLGDAAAAAKKFYDIHIAGTRALDGTKLTTLQQSMRDLDAVRNKMSEIEQNILSTESGMGERNWLQRFGDKEQLRVYYEDLKKLQGLYEKLSEEQSKMFGQGGGSTGNRLSDWKEMKDVARDTAEQQAFLAAEIERVRQEVEGGTDAVKSFKDALSELGGSTSDVEKILQLAQMGGLEGAEREIAEEKEKHRQRVEGLEKVMELMTQHEQLTKAQRARAMIGLQEELDLEIQKIEEKYAKIEDRDEKSADKLKQIDSQLKAFFENSDNTSFAKKAASLAKKKDAMLATLKEEDDGTIASMHRIQLANLMFTQQEEALRNEKLNKIRDFNDKLSALEEKNIKGVDPYTAKVQELDRSLAEVLKTMDGFEEGSEEFLKAKAKVALLRGEIIATGPELIKLGQDPFAGFQVGIKEAILATKTLGEVGAEVGKALVKTFEDSFKFLISGDFLDVFSDKIKTVNDKIKDLHYDSLADGMEKFQYLQSEYDKHLSKALDGSDKSFEAYMSNLDTYLAQAKENLSPEEYTKVYEKTMTDLNELNKGFSDNTSKIWEGLGDIWDSFCDSLVTSFVSALAELAAKAAASSVWNGITGDKKSDSSSGSSNSGWVNTAVSTVGSWVASLFADGGYIGSHPGGGVIRAGSGVRDDVFLGKTGNTMNYGMGGEYIVNKKATAKFLPLLEELNSRGFADGGQVSGGRSSTVFNSSGNGYLTQLIGGLSATNQAIQGTTTALEGLSATIQEPNGPTRDLTQSIGEYSATVTTSAREVAAQTVEIKDSVEATKDAKEGVREFGITTSDVVSGIVDLAGYAAEKVGKMGATALGGMLGGPIGALAANVAYEKFIAPLFEKLTSWVKDATGATMRTVSEAFTNIEGRYDGIFGDFNAAIGSYDKAAIGIGAAATSAEVGAHNIGVAAEDAFSSISQGTYSMTSAAENAFGSISMLSAAGVAAMTAATSAVSAISSAGSSAAYYDMSGSSSGAASHEATGRDMGWWATGGWIGKYGSGRINQGSGTKDDVFLGYTNGGRTRNFGMGGEFVVNKKSAAKHAGLLNTINRDFADGGSITPAPTSTTVPLRRDSQISQYLGSMMTEAVDAFSALKYYEDQLNSSRESAVDVLKEAVELSDNEELRDLLTGYVGEIEKNTLTDYQLSLREIQKTYEDALETATELGAVEENLDIIRQASALATQKLIDENQEAINSILKSYTSILDDHDFSSYELEARDMLDTAEAAIVEIGKLGAAEEEMAIIRAATILQLYNLEQQRQDEIKSALSSYQGLLDVEGLSNYERSVRDVSLAQVEAEETLTGLGASLEDFQTVAEGVALQLAEIEKQRQNEVKSALSSYQGLLDVEGLSDYERSIRDVALAQAEAEETLTELGASFRDFQTVTEGVALQLAEIEKQRQDSVDSTLSSYREFLDTSLLTAYELAVRNLNVSYQDSIDTLNELGATEAELSVLRTAYFAEMRDALADETRTAIDSYLADLLDKTAAANDKLAESESALNEAQSLLEQSFTESITEAGEMYRDEIDKLNESISSTTSNMKSLRSMIDSLVGSPEQQQAKYETAQAALKSRYRSGNFSGDLSDISGATDISSSMFKSSVDMERETAKTSIMLDSLADKASSQLSADEKRLAALEKLRDDTIAELELQREIMLGTEEASSLTIEELKAQLEQAQITYEQDLAAAEAAEKFYKKQEFQLEEEYNSILGIETSLAVSLPQIRALLSSLITAQYKSSSLMEKYVRSSSTSLYGSYSTGTDYVPKTGPYLLHKGEAVVPANEVQTETSRLLSVLISETKAGNVAIAKNTAAMAKYIKLWDGTGLPESREVAV